jgi:hypothetical protein
MWCSEPSISLEEREDIMKSNEQPRKAAYQSPRVVSPGNASELTFGNGTVYTDSLGDTQTSYGKHREAEAAESVEPGLLDSLAGTEQIQASDNR